MELGKTVPTYREELEKRIRKWKPFRDALRRREREAFDEIMELVRENASAAMNQATPNPMEGIYISILLGQETKIKSLEEKVKELEERLEEQGREEGRIREEEKEEEKEKEEEEEGG